QYREARREPARGLGRSRGAGFRDVPAGDAAADAPRHRCRFHARLHPRDRRIRHSGAPRRARHADDRPRPLERVLRQPRLAGGGGGRHRHARRGRRADHVHAHPRRAAGGGPLMRRIGFTTVIAVIGFVFLYAPILSLVIYSFNASRLVTVWGGFSTRWYGELLRDPQILRAAWISLQIAVATATIAVVLGTLAAFVLMRFGRFRSRALLSGMVTAPLVMPEVITGLSLLLLFVSMEQIIGWPTWRGLTTIIIARTTFRVAFCTGG